ncbi:MAG: hypothetical protein KDD85_09160 [Parvularculaceae bacterium]|nr:hypothetical protein [Parvularculaceae bacterium]
MKIDTEKVSEIIAETAEREMMSRYKRLDPDSVRSKSAPTDLVTIVDEAMERDLRRALMDLTPGAAFVGEESAAADPSITAEISRAERCWIVDPLDGTRNFVNHIDEFGTIVAYVERGAVAAAWIYAAPTRQIAVGVKGGGVTWDGERLTPKPFAGDPPKGWRSTGWLNESWRAHIVDNLKVKTASRAGHCAAYAYLQLIKGEVDFKLSSRIHAWDHAAGAMMAEELGGEARWLENAKAYRPQESVDRPYLATAPGRDWRSIAALILD